MNPGARFGAVIGARSGSNRPAHLEELDGLHLGPATADIEWLLQTAAAVSPEQLLARAHLEADHHDTLAAHSYPKHYEPWVGHAIGALQDRFVGELSEDAYPTDDQYTLLALTTCVGVAVAARHVLSRPLIERLYAPWLDVVGRRPPGWLPSAVAAPSAPTVRT